MAVGLYDFYICKGKDFEAFYKGFDRLITLTCAFVDLGIYLHHAGDLVNGRVSRDDLQYFGYYLDLDVCTILNCWD